MANQQQQASAYLTVYTQVAQSQANKDYWAAYSAWRIAVMEAEERRRRAELEALIQAYYEYLRLQRLAQQTTQPTSPKLLGGGGGGGGVAAMFMGGVGAIIAQSINQALGKSPLIKTPSPNSATGFDVCEIAPVWDWIGYGASLFGPAFTTLKGFLTTVSMTGAGMALADKCADDDSAVLNQVVNAVIITAASLISLKVTAGAIILVILKDAFPSNLPPRNMQEWQSYQRDFYAGNRQLDSYHTAGDRLVDHVQDFYYYGEPAINFPQNWNDGDRRFPYASPNNPHPISRALQSDNLGRAVDEFIDLFKSAQNPAQASAYVDYFVNAQFPNVLTELGLSGASDIVADDYPLFGHAVLLEYLTKNNLLNEDILSAIHSHLAASGIPNPNGFIDPIINHVVERTAP